MNNYILKNIKHILNSTSTQILEYDNNDIECIILGGYVSNITNYDQDDLAAQNDYFTMKIYNKITNQYVNLYNDILIKPNTSFPINRIHFNINNYITINSTYENNLQLTLSYIKIFDYDYGIIKVNFEPIEIISLFPSWNFENEDLEYFENEYISKKKGKYKIEFSNILGWERPDSIDVLNPQLRITEIKPTYVLTDSIVSFYTNQIELANLFQYKLVDSEVWINNNEITILPPGEYEFEFKELDNFVKHENITLVTEEKTRYQKSVILKKIKETVTVNLTPPSVRLSNKSTQFNRWRVEYNNNLSEWYDSDDTIYFDILDNYVLHIETNDFYTPSVNNISFDLIHNQPLIFNVNMVQNA